MSEFHAKSYEHLEKQLRDFTTWHGDKSVHDVGGAFHLWRALLANLGERSSEEDVTQYAATLCQDEITLLERIVAAAKNSNGGTSDENT